MNQPKMDIYQNTYAEEVSESENFINQILNQIFMLNESAARNRHLVFSIAFLGIWMFLAIFLHPFLDFSFYAFERLAQYNYFPIDVINHLIAVFFAWDVLLIMSGIYLSGFVSRQLASIYLADVFEIKDLSIAEKFISQAAFANSYIGAIHIEDGQVRTEDHKSPSFRIGGPGIVQINLENAAVFEKMDGSSTIVSPTATAPYILEGFERLRTVIDLRDQTTNFSINSRTRDGIKVEIKDIRLIFSVFRDNISRTLTRPYPFNKEGLNWLIYNQTKGPWTSSLVGLVRGELARYISQHNLSEILAAPGEPEIQQQINHHQMISKKIRTNHRHTTRYKTHRLMYGKRKRNGPNYLPIYFWKAKHKKDMRYSRQFANLNVKYPSFATRNQLSNIFYDEFNSNFIQRAHQRGVHLEWINVGTWHTPTSLVLEQHMDAWAIASENEVRSNPKVLNSVKAQARQQELSNIIRQLPGKKLADYQYYQLPVDEIFMKLIQDYAAKLRLAADLYRAQKGRVPKQIETALKHIRNLQLQEIKNEGGVFIGD